MTTVTGKLIGADHPERMEVTAALVDVTGQPVIGYVGDEKGELVTQRRITPGTDGSWTADLVANTNVSSLAGDTLWAIQEGRSLAGAPNMTYIVVPTSGGPYWIGDIRVDLSGTQTGQGTVVYVAAAPGTDGADGRSAYEVAVDGGFVGTQAEWLASLVGPQGAPGEQGLQGLTGADGRSAYEVAQDEGFPGTEQEWLASLVGPKGDPGDNSGSLDEAKAYTDTTVAAEVVRADGAYDPAGSADSAQTLAAADATAKVTAHTALSDPHGDRAAAATSLAGHVSAVDPHGDRAYADGKLAKTANLSDLGSASTARTNLGLGTAATRGVGTTTGTVAAGDDARITGALPASGGTITGNLAVTGYALGGDSPAAHGAAAWCYDPALAVNSTQLTSGTLYLTRVNLAAAVTATKLYWWIGNQGSSPTAGQNQIGLYNAAGTLMASATVDSDITTPGLKTTTVSGQALTAGAFYWVGLLFNASVPPTLTRASGWTGVGIATSLGLPPSGYRFAINGTARTTLPATISPASNTATDFAGPWVAVGP